MRQSLDSALTPIIETSAKYITLYPNSETHKNIDFIIYDINSEQDQSEVESTINSPKK